MAQFLFDCLDALRPQVESAARLLLFLDFDGTLAPIVDFPENAALPESTRLVLSEMTQRPTFLVSLISGRALEDLRRRADLRGVFYAGNHGLEIRGPEIEYVEPRAVERRPALSALVRALRTKLLPFEGVEIENKHLSASVHFRRAEKKDARDTVLGALEELTDWNIFRLREGRMVAEILPRVAADKGTAVRRIRGMRGAAGDLTICAGDDTSDEDLFAAADGGITIQVNKGPATTAKYFVNDPDEIRKFLIWLLEVKDPTNGR